MDSLLNIILGQKVFVKMNTCSLKGWGINFHFNLTFLLISFFSDSLVLKGQHNICCVQTIQSISFYEKKDLDSMCVHICMYIDVL